MRSARGARSQGTRQAQGREAAQQHILLPCSSGLGIPGSTQAGGGQQRARTASASGAGSVWSAMWSPSWSASGSPPISALKLCGAWYTCRHPGECFK